MKISNYIYVWIFLLLFISNPTVKNFKEYLGKTSYDGLKRKYNLFIISIYEANDTTYIGLFGNFFPIIHWVDKPVSNQTNNEEVISTDTSKNLLHLN